jgi:uncharacterized membrane protein YbaN (DUF454 family)
MVYIKKTFIYTLIVLLVCLGFVGLALPIVPQTIFFLIAVILISFEVPWMGRKIEKFLGKYPEILQIYLKHKSFLEKHLK